MIPCYLQKLFGVYMRKLFLLLAFLNSFIFAQIDVENYSINLEFDEHDSAHIKGEIKAQFNIKGNINAIRFKNYEAAIDSVKYSNDSHVEYAISGDTLIIEPYNKTAKFSELLVYFSYAINPDRLNKNICILPPYIENNLADYSIALKIPKKYNIYSNLHFYADESDSFYNILNGRTKNNILKTTIVVAPKGFYKSLHSETSGIPINLYYKNDASKADMEKLLAEINNALQYFNDLLGAYLYDELTIIEDADPAAFYINSQPGLIIASSSLMTQKYSQWSYHEAAHQWFGSGIYFHPNEGWPISEPMAEMLKLMCIEKYEHQDGAKKYMDEVIEEYKTDYQNTNEDGPLLNSEANRLTYLKGPIIYAKLRKCLGESSWVKLLRQVYTSYKDQFLTLEDFLNILESIDADCADKFREDIQSIDILY